MYDNNNGHFFTFLIFLLQGVQLLVCDWLLSTRTAIWQEEQDDESEDNTEPHTASPPELQAFQQDLARYVQNTTWKVDSLLCVMLQVYMNGISISVYQCIKYKLYLLKQFYVAMYVMFRENCIHF